MNNYNLYANVFVKYLDKYLVIKRSMEKHYYPGFVQPVGGRIEENEDPYDAGLREVKEESGLILHDMRLAAIFTHELPNSPEDNSMHFYFVAYGLDDNTTPCDEGELLWLTREELWGQKLLPHVKLVLPDMLNEKGGPMFVKFVHKDLETIETYKIHGSV